MRIDAIIRGISQEGKTADFVIATENPVRDRGGFRPTVLWTGGLNLSKYRGVVLSQHEHAPEKVVAKSERIWTEAGRVIATARFDTEDPYAASVWGKVERGYLKAASAGFRLLCKRHLRAGELDAETGVRAPEDTDIDLALEWELIEWSIVAVGADADCIKIRSVSGRERHMPEPIMGFDEIRAAALSSYEPLRLRAAYAALENPELVVDVARRLKDARVRVDALLADPAQRFRGAVQIEAAAGYAWAGDVARVFAMQRLARELAFLEGLTVRLDDPIAVTTLRQREAGSLLRGVKPGASLPQLGMRHGEQTVGVVYAGGIVGLTREYMNQETGGMQALYVGGVLADVATATVRMILAARLHGVIPEEIGCFPSLYPSSPFSADGTETYWSATASARPQGVNLVESNGLSALANVEAAAVTLGAQTLPDSSSPAGHRVRALVVPAAKEFTARQVLRSVSLDGDREPAALVVLPEMDRISATTWFALDAGTLAYKAAIPPRIIWTIGNQLRDEELALAAEVAVDFTWLQSTGAIENTA